MAHLKNVNDDLLFSERGRALEALGDARLSRRHGRCPAARLDSRRSTPPRRQKLSQRQVERSGGRCRDPAAA